MELGCSCVGETPYCEQAEEYNRKIFQKPSLISRRTTLGFTIGRWNTDSITRGSSTKKIGKKNNM